MPLFPLFTPTRHRGSYQLGGWIKSIICGLATLSKPVCPLVNPSVGWFVSPCFCLSVIYDHKRSIADHVADHAGKCEKALL